MGVPLLPKIVFIIVNLLLLLDAKCYVDYKVSELLNYQGCLQIWIRLHNIVYLAKLTALKHKI